MSWPHGYGRRVLAEVDSTNAEALRLSRTVAGPEWILARHQTAARGRRGRAWRHPEGNFSASLLMHPAEPPATLALRSFVAALALHDALTEITGQAEGLALKWPNDVLLNGGKLAGILLEAAAPDGLVIGVGVNLAAAPDAGEVESGTPVALATETGHLVTPEDFLGLLARSYAAREDAYLARGFAPIREAWLARATRLGQEITARTGRDTVTGRFETVDAEGRLVLKTRNARVALSAADIYF